MRYRHSTFGAAAECQAPAPTVLSPIAAGKGIFRVPTRNRRPVAASAQSVATAAQLFATTQPAAPGSTAVEPQLDPELLTGFVDVVGITDVTHDVKTFELRAAWMPSVDFAPGQYVTMRIPELGLERCYSISSAPFGTNTFTITVKRVAGGAVSTYLHDTVRVGDRIHVDGPYGLFSTSFHPAQRHLFLSAGSGITPIMSMVRSLLARQGGSVTDIAFVHSAATPVDIIFRAELEQLAELAGVSVTILCSRDSDSETWTGRRGRLDARTLAEVVPDAAERETFVCGPSGYMDAVRPLLAEAGVAQVHEESFVFATAPADRVARARSGGRAGLSGAAPAGACHTIDFVGSARRIDCDSDTTVLDAALDAGLSMPSSCSEGACGTCKSTLVSGEVEMNHAGGIRPKEIAAGKFLPCCSTPLSDLVVER
ncbi:hybrid-cluster NAD(P)-dependent oxidoreductase [Brevibacterium atlanticum]|uniref:hybrid-cluster NAD(P)-dependent oxidoreductase n=1 Tax=Brevibacterium atlanticum TaxID=2697563 RepID=UPI001422E190|nr:hybrid-cluster NAD(P)-dependent oxidoreductase [Brevibacterium atlanticum]